MKKIVSFGDSFVFGSELANNPGGINAWPGLAAQELGYAYQTTAIPGCGNDNIARQIYSYFSENSAKDTLSVVNWTWLARWDFYIIEHETWITLGETCVPERLKDLVTRTQAEDMIEFYKKRANSSLLWNKFRNLQTIWAAQQFMIQKGVKSVQTYMDYELFDQRYHAPNYIKELQNLVQPTLQLFDDKNFVDWSHSFGYPVTVEGNHPLEDAHLAAKNYWKEIYKTALKI
jgi:hypothetical protein